MPPHSQAAPAEDVGLSGTLTDVLMSLVWLLSACLLHFERNWELPVPTQAP